MNITNKLIERYKYTVILLIGIGLTLNSCKSFIEVDAPKTQLTRATVFKDAATAEAAVLDVLGKLRGQSANSTSASMAGLNWLTGLHSDELDLYGPLLNGYVGDIYKNTMMTNNSNVLSVWKNGFAMIYALNSIIEGVKATSDSDIQAIAKNKLIGEALFLRSYINLYLTSLFGDIPYVNSTDYNVNKSISRSKVAEIHAHLVTDLKASISLLPETYSSVDRVRPNAAVARALLARVYLYQGSWQNAEDMATATISNSLFNLLEDVKMVFLKDSRETLWQFSPQSANAATGEAKLYVYASAPPSTIAMTSPLIESFSETDKRFDNWVKTVFDSSGKPYYYSYKYKNNLEGSNTNELSIQLRLAEQYLIRAEARIHLNRLEGARNDINELRIRAGIGIATSNDPDVLLNDVIEERNRELFLEYPHRFFDLVRMGRTDIVSANKPGWGAKDMHWPIPETELGLNPNLEPQNPGFN